jgi:hypothetical protein
MKKYLFNVITPMMLITVMSSIGAIAQDVNENTPKVFLGAKYFKTWIIGANVGFAVPKVVVGGENDYPNAQAQLGYGAYLQKKLLGL